VSSRQLKIGYYTLEALTSFAATFYLNYLLFFTYRDFSFTDRDNLLLNALHGGVYVVSSWLGGKFIQRVGCFKALKLGFAGMAVGLALGLFIQGVAGVLIGLASWTIPLCLIWPSLETLVTEGEDFAGTARYVGIYNVVWSAANAVAFCMGGWMWQTLGVRGLYGIPLALMFAQLVLTLWLEAEAKRQPVREAKPRDEQPHQPEAKAYQQKVPPRRFLQMAWLANPFAYVAMNTVSAVIPHLADRFQLTASQTGLFCSLWFYARFASFVALWQWTGWHYRFRWLVMAFIALIASFALMLLARELWIVVVAQLALGASVGLMYYSSLFYSMDAGGDSKGEHGGFHEAMIGAGICGGPLIGAMALSYASNSPNAGVYAVTTLLIVGLAALVGLYLRRR
jgi:predicted MFS family arabinose efflux permease